MNNNIQETQQEIENAIKMLYSSKKIGLLPFNKVLPVLKELSKAQNTVGIKYLSDDISKYKKGKYTKMVLDLI